MRSEGQKWSDHESDREFRATSRGYKISTLLAQDYIWRLLDTIVSIPSTHYVHSDIFKITKFNAELLSEYGGVSRSSSSSTILRV